MEQKSHMKDGQVLTFVDVTERPIIEFNVIERLALRKGKYPTSSALMVQRLCSALNVRHKTAKAVLSVLN